MFCPKCSKQHDPKSANSYCSGCGFYLEEIIESLSNDGRVERVVENEFPATRRQVFTGMGLMVFGLVFLILSLIIGTPEPSMFVQFNMLVGVLASIFGVGFITHSLLPSKTQKAFLSKPGLSEKTPRVLEDGRSFTPSADYSPPVQKRQKVAVDVSNAVIEETTRELKISDNRDLKG